MSPWYGRCKVAIWQSRKFSSGTKVLFFMIMKDMAILVLFTLYNAPSNMEFSSSMKVKFETRNRWWSLSFLIFWLINKFLRMDWYESHLIRNSIRFYIQFQGQILSQCHENSPRYWISLGMRVSSSAMNWPSSYAYRFCQTRVDKVNRVRFFWACTISKIDVLGAFSQLHYLIPLDECVS